MSLDHIDLQLRQCFRLPGGMPEFRLDPGRAALVVIDMQRLDAHRDGEFGRRADVHGVRGHVEWFFDRLEHLTVPAIAALLAAAREAGMPVVMSQYR